MTVAVGSAATARGVELPAPAVKALAIAASMPKVIALFATDPDRPIMAHLRFQADWGIGVRTLKNGTDSEAPDRMP